MWRESLRRDLDNTKRLPIPQQDLQWYVMANQVILTILGRVWWKAHLAADKRDADQFLRVKPETEDPDFDHIDRVVRLGHMLYGLKDCKGFEAFVRSLRSSRLEPAYFELWVADALNRNGFELEFAKQARKNQRGKVYDLSARKGAVTTFIEVKSRRNKSILDPSTLRNALESARKQLPKSGPGAIFVLIHPEWPQTDDAENTICQCVDSFFQKTQRVNYVVIVWQTWKPLDSGIARASLSYFRQMINPRPRSLTDVGELIKRGAELISQDPNRQEFTPSFW